MLQAEKHTDFPDVCRFQDVKIMQIENSLPQKQISIVHL